MAAPSGSGPVRALADAISALKVDIGSAVQGEASSAEDDETLAALKSLIKTDGLVESMNLFVAYQGFDPAIIRRVLRSKEPDAAKRGIDVFYMIAICLNRGTSVLGPKNGKSKQKMIEKVNELTVKYDLKRVTIQNDNTCLTLPRVLNSFPEVVFEFLLKGKCTTRPVTPTDMKASKFSDYPLAACGTFIFNLIPPPSTNDEKREGLIAGALAYSVAEYRVLNNKRSGVLREKNEILSHVLTYALAAYHSCLVDPQTRRNLINRLNLGVATTSAWKQTFELEFQSGVDVLKNFD